MNKKLVNILFLLFIVACTHSDEGKERFNRNDFKKSTKLKGTIVKFDSPLNPLSYTIIRDSLIIVTNWDGNPYYLEIYKLNTKRLVTKIARKGNGPNEFLSCNLIYRNLGDDFFAVHDIIKQTITKYNIDSVILRGEDYAPTQVNLPRYTKDANFLDSNTIVGYNSYYFKSEKISNDIKPLFSVKKHEPLTDKIDSTKAKYFTSNVSGAYILISPATDRIWMVNHYQDRIDVFNKKLEFIHSINGPDGIKPLYESYESHVSFKHKYYRAYYPCIYTKNAVYMIYLGVNGVPNHMPFEKPVEVFKFNWTGELLANYKLDKYIYNLSIDKNEKYLYGSSTRAVGMYPQLVQYKINE